jgi:hypothetical protein
VDYSTSKQLSTGPSVLLTADFDDGHFLLIHLNSTYQRRIIPLPSEYLGPLALMTDTVFSDAEGTLTAP